VIGSRQNDAIDPERTFDRSDNGESVYAPVEHPRVWTNAPDGEFIAMIAGAAAWPAKNVGEPCAPRY
jgi:hypothetical protein